MSENAGPGQRNFGLDIARCAAVSMVLLSHSLGDIYSKKIPFLWYGVFIGVELFFSLSGFLIGRILLDIFDRHSTHLSLKHISRFWLRRWLRTLPLYYILYLLFLFFYNQWIYPAHFNWRNLLFLQNIASPPNGFYGESWSLSIEEWFYLGIPLLLYLAYVVFRKKIQGRHDIIFISIVALIIIIQIIARLSCPDCTPWGCIAVLFRFDAIAYGLSGAYIARFIPAMSRTRSLWTMITGLLLCLAAAIIKFRLSDRAYTGQWYYPVNGAGTILLIMGLYYFPFTKRYRAIVFTSKISYSIYLTHLTGIILPLVWFTKDTALAGTLTLWVISLLLIFVLSYITYTCIEKPFMKLRDKWLPAQ